MEPRRPTPEPIPENLLHSLSALGMRIDGIQNTFLLSANSLQNALFHAKLSRTMIADNIRTNIHQLRVETVFVRERAERTDLGAVGMGEEQADYVGRLLKGDREG